MERLLDCVPDELKSLIGPGAKPTLCAFKHGLCAVAGVTKVMSQDTSGCKVVGFLQDRVKCIIDPVEFRGRQYPPEVMMQMLTLLLDLKGTGRRVRIRRYDALRLLGLSMTDESWRRPGGYEFQLMYWFAGTFA